MDSKQNTGAPDKDLINVTEDYELQYWSQKYNISRDELKAAGTSAKAVVAYLNKQ